MNRRSLMKPALAAPAATALIAPPPAAAQGPAGTPAADTAELATAIADDAAEARTQFFTAPQLAALRKLSDLIFPAIGEQPGALAAGAPEFLDFYIGASPAARQALYRNGLDALDNGAKKRFRKPFSELESSQAEALLEPLKQPWTYHPPADPLAHFLREAKADIRTATMNSREFSAFTSRGSRRGAGMGLYWYPLD